ncbi:glutathione synthase [Shewanella algae]|uniref:glutathione synthase n=1 Tax=Shewanella algae TaxID=38313 RepID=UPI000C31CF29|nr:glutathione synthase [Shewanella algae]MBO2628131.1 glutathione synthase [Shewanella algae]MBO2640776.1 glutathione synthase [Shewanella algae]MBO2644956.1 glutathione synthase [Shewanella algae]MCE9774000.1 glutathione synthase [Shewanella algae]QTE96357.1 glutathione synthase [Shewanella algae]
MSQAQKMRDRVKDVLDSGKLHDHQRNAAQKTFDALQGDVRAVVTAAEMQAGKSGVALALCCLQRLSMTDEDICNRAKLKDTLYLVTMPDTALLDQAQDDLKDARNVVVSNFVRFEKDLEASFRGNPPKLIIIDECHYGSNINAVRYSVVFDYLERENDDCKVVFISATPFGALYAAESEYLQAVEIKEEAEEEGDKQTAAEAQAIADEAAKNSILRRNFKTKLVFHRTSDEYYGVREMLKANRVISLSSEARNFLFPSAEREQFIQQYLGHQGAGWSLVRVPAGTAMDAKQYFISEGVPEHNIFILGQSLTGVPEDQLTTIEQFKQEFDDCIDFGDKLIAITVAGCRAGINFGALMKNHLISTWDSTVASIAAVVQANIGRACGYHGNNDALHFTNIDAALAYGATLDYLEQNTSNTAASDFDGLREFFHEICDEYHVEGLDVGVTIKHKRRKPIGDVETYLTDSYVVVPGQLIEPDYDYTQHTNDVTLLKAIELIREEYTRDAGPSVKGHRAMRGKRRNWIKAQWVNGDTFDNKEKAVKTGTMKERILTFTQALDRGEKLEYNQIVMPGSGESSESKLVTATILSVYNMSRRNVAKKIMTPADVHTMCDHFGIQHDDTLIVLFKRGEYDATRSLEKKNHNEKPNTISKISNETQFGEAAEVTSA